jgi:hypothetical protein
MDAVLGCKPSSEPLVVVDSNWRSESTNETIDVLGDQLGGEDAEVASILRESQEESVFERIVDSEINSASPAIETTDSNSQKVLNHKIKTPPLDRES